MNVREVIVCGERVQEYRTVRYEVVPSSRCGPVQLAGAVPRSRRQARSDQPKPGKQATRQSRMRMSLLIQDEDTKYAG